MNRDSLLSRVDIVVPLSQLLESVSEFFDIGKIEEFEPIPVGYEELNLKTITSQGVFVIKIFSKLKNPETIKDNIKGLLEFAKAGIPVPVLVQKNNEHLFKTVGKHGHVFVCVMDFFDGKSFLEIEPNEKDILVITDYIIKIHSLSFPIQHRYDNWSVVNLLQEYEKRKQYLQTKDLELVKKAVEQFKTIDFSKLPKSIIHADLQKQHILKNENNEYCILDLGVMDYNARIIDLAIFLILFCKKEQFNLVLNRYSKTHPLSEYELSSLPILMNGIFAIDVIRANYELVVNKDDSQQTKYWLQLGRKGLNSLSS